MGMKEEIYIYGAGNRGKELCCLIEKRYSESICIEGFLDKYREGNIGPYKISLSSNGIPKNRKIVISIADFNVALQTAMELSARGAEAVYWFDMKKERARYLDFFSEQCVSCNGWHEDALLHVEFHAMDACNLNCVGCTHFSPIFPMEKPNTKERLADLALLRKKISGIADLYIMGGEPLLNDEIEEYISEAKRQYPEAFLLLVTNGLLLPRCSDEFLDFLSSRNVCVSISEYAPTHRIIAKITDRLNSHNVIYNIRPFEQKQKFNKPLSRSKTRERYCISPDCVNIWNKKIARCPTLMYITEFNRKFALDFPTDGIIDLTSDISGVELKERLSAPVPLCDHCSRNEIEWSVCKKDVTASDFAVM